MTFPLSHPGLSAYDRHLLSSGVTGRSSGCHVLPLVTAEDKDVADDGPSFLVDEAGQWVAALNGRVVTVWRVRDKEDHIEGIFQFRARLESLGPLIEVRRLVSEMSRREKRKLSSQIHGFPLLNEGLLFFMKSPKNLVCVVLETGTVHHLNIRGKDPIVKVSKERGFVAVATNAQITVYALDFQHGL